MTRDNDILLAVAAFLSVAAYLLVAEDVPQGSDGTGDSSVNDFANNNPGNLIYISGDPFTGQIGNNAGFGIYDTAQHGVHAMGETLDQFYGSGLTTVTQILSKYSPDSRLQAYINSVSGETPGNPYALQDDPNEPLSWPDDKLSLVMAMIYQEQGSNPYAESDVNTWLGS